MLGATSSGRDLILCGCLSGSHVHVTCTFVPTAIHTLQRVQSEWNERTREFHAGAGASGTRTRLCQSGREQHGERGGVGVHLWVNPYLADQLCHRAFHVRLHPGRTMIEPEVRQAWQENAS
jgi:hypothetical protein